MAKAANILHSLVPISQFNKGKAAQIFDRLRTEKELVVLKNNQPSAVILSPEEYTRLTEIEEDYMLLIEANSRLEANGDKPAISFTNVLNDLGRNIIATGIGGAIGGGLSMLWGADSHIPASGMFALPTMTKPLSFIFALLIGSLATAITILILKKRVDVNEEIVIKEKKEEEDVSWDDLKIS